jgi:hypothetical protein
LQFGGGFNRASICFEVHAHELESNKVEGKHFTYRLFGVGIEVALG